MNQKDMNKVARISSYKWKYIKTYKVGRYKIKLNNKFYYLYWFMNKNKQWLKK